MIETVMLAVALEDTVIDLIIGEEIAPKRNARRALIRGGLISILIPCPLHRYEAELGRFPKIHIMIKICNREIMSNWILDIISKIITHFFIRLFICHKKKEKVLLPVDIFVLWMNTRNRF